MESKPKTSQILSVTKISEKKVDKRKKAYKQ